MDKQRLKDLAATGFVAFEACMHVYLFWYLTFHWTNLAIWAFTGFELSMFIFLLWNGKGKDNHGVIREACSACARLCKRIHD